MSHDKKIIDSCKRNLEQAETDMRSANATLLSIGKDIKGFYQLCSSVASSEKEVQTVQGRAIALRNKNMELQNTSLDISLYLGSLVARTETIKINYNAAQFAKAVIAVEKLLVTPTKIEGLIRDDAQQLDSTLEMIAQSNVVAVAFDDMM